MDEYHDDWTHLWWARADGAATIHDSDEAAVDALAARYPAYQERRPCGPVVSVEVSRWSGWSFTPPDGHRSH
ncbi:hypothetical protein J2S57_005478 [Kineosporia succinea]|uniref:DUF5678 domain-containing protein n=1 Tax=Kineosporia succinea TaxID=84632 RepID=A0ABT9PAL1_9ACTN|nr:hypothetical protein [Kineosporia succinea]MDP9829729.1 hypothetical protein [Kineosporia succinea]